MKCFWVGAAFSKASREPGKAAANVCTNEGQCVRLSFLLFLPEWIFHNVNFYDYDCYPTAVCTPHLLGPKGYPESFLGSRWCSRHLRGLGSFCCLLCPPLLRTDGNFPIANVLLANAAEVASPLPRLDHTQHQTEGLCT